MNKQVPDILSDQAQSHLNRTILKLAWPAILEQFLICMASLARHRHGRLYRCFCHCRSGCQYFQYLAHQRLYHLLKRGLFLSDLPCSRLR